MRLGVKKFSKNVPPLAEKQQIVEVVKILIDLLSVKIQYNEELQSVQDLFDLFLQNLLLM